MPAKVIPPVQKVLSPPPPVAIPKAIASEERAPQEKPSAAEILYSTAPMTQAVPSQVATIPESRHTVAETPSPAAAKMAKIPALETRASQEKSSTAEMLYSTAPSMLSAPLQVTTIPQIRQPVADIPSTPITAIPAPAASEIRMFQERPPASENIYSIPPTVPAVPTHVATIPQSRLSTVDLPPSAPLVVRPPPPVPEVLPEPAFWGNLRATPNRSRR